MKNEKIIYAVGKGAVIEPLKCSCGCGCAGGEGAGAGSGAKLT